MNPIEWIEYDYVSSSPTNMILRQAAPKVLKSPDCLALEIEKPWQISTNWTFTIKFPVLLLGYYSIKASDNTCGRTRVGVPCLGRESCDVTDCRQMAPRAPDGPTCSCLWSIIYTLYHRNIGESSNVRGSFYFVFIIDINWMMLNVLHRPSS